jgi:peptidyl-tRNA hydrolase
MDPSDYVLQDFSRDEAAELSGVLDRAAQAVQTFVRDGLDRTMSKFNGNPGIE